MRILITGHRGFVGNYFYRRLITLGHDVVGIDIVEGNDARDFFRTSDTQFDCIFHFAAVVGGRQKIEREPLTLAVDLSIDAEMFSWAIRTKPRRVVYFSSSAAYPTQYQSDPFVLCEDDIDLDKIRNPDLTYGWAKLTGEMLAKYARECGIKVHIFRPFSGYGTNQALDYPFPSFIDRAQRRLDPFPIWGDGNQVRDFIHISDIFHGVMAGIDAEIEVSNLCNGRGTSFNELAEMVCREAGYAPTFEHHLSEPVGVQYRVGNHHLMLSYYQPKISLEEGIRRAFAGS